MRRNLPTFPSLMCFEAVARHLSFTRAAQELNLTQSAVSRQVKNLEDFLNVALFVREKKRVSLSAEGMRYYEEVCHHFDGLETATLKVMSCEQDERYLNVGTFPTFGSRWLIPHLSEFATLHPGIQTNITTGLKPFDFDSQAIDVGIQHGDGHWPALHVEELFKEEVVAVCAPSLIAGLPSDAVPQESHFSYLHLMTRRYAWPEWLAAKNIKTPPVLHGPQFETFGYLIRAALSGLGVAIVPVFFVKAELDEGTLIEPFGPPIKSERGYYLVTSQAKRNHDHVKKFSQWILESFSN